MFCVSSKIGMKQVSTSPCCTEYHSLKAFDIVDLVFLPATSIRCTSEAGKYSPPPATPNAAHTFSHINFMQDHPPSLLFFIPGHISHSHTLPHWSLTSLTRHNVFHLSLRPRPNPSRTLYRSIPCHILPHSQWPTHSHRTPSSTIHNHNNSIRDTSRSRYHHNHRFRSWRNSDNHSTRCFHHRDATHGIFSSTSRHGKCSTRR